MYARAFDCVQHMFPCWVQPRLGIATYLSHLGSLLHLLAGALALQTHRHTSCVGYNADLTSIMRQQYEAFSCLQHAVPQHALQYIP